MEVVKSTFAVQLEYASKKPAVLTLIVFMALVEQTVIVTLFVKRLAIVQTRHTHAKRISVNFKTAQQIASATLSSVPQLRTVIRLALCANLVLKALRL
jgi:hypothetical protein